MNKTESIARRILGWKLNRWDRWFDHEKKIFIPTTDFQPEKNLGHAMLIVNRLEKLGFKFTKSGSSEVSFNDFKATGGSLAEAITNAAYSIIERNTETSSTKIWRQLC